MANNQATLAHAQHNDKNGERERERERDGETDAVETPRANAWTAMTHDEIVKTGSSKITKAIVQLLAHKASQHRRSCWLLVFIYYIHVYRSFSSWLFK